MSPRPVVHEVRVAVTRYMTFRIENPLDAWDAIGRAERKVWDGKSPDEEDLPSLEVQSVKVGGREIEFSDRLDWSGPKDEHDLTRFIHIARVDGRPAVENHDFESVVRLAEAAIEDGGQCRA